MKVAAIICEYNPFHKGHQYHIELTKKITGCDALICIMSGSFMQRGIPAIIDKWSRAETAVLCGADLVLELPVIYATSSAEIFAKGSVSILDDLGIVDFLSFGSECGDAELIKNTSKILAMEPVEYKEILKHNLKLGLPFARAREKALKGYLHKVGIDFGNEKELQELLSSSNNILAIEYCKALYNRNSNIEPITIVRQGESYNSLHMSSGYASATAIREKLKSTYTQGLEPFMPAATIAKLNEIKSKGVNFAYEEHMFPYLKYKLLTQRELHKLPDVSEGLDNCIYQSLHSADSFHGLVMGAKSKRYTYTRISRILCQYFIGLEQFPLSSLRNSTSDYARVLAFNDVGRIVLKQIKASSGLEVITKLPKTTCSMLEADLKSTASYSVLNPSLSSKEDYIRGPVYI